MGKYRMNLKNVSQLSQGNEALRESEQWFRQIAENIKEVFWITDPVKNEWMYVSPAYKEIWGRSPDALGPMAHYWLGAIHPDDIGCVLAAVVTKQIAGNYDEEYRIVRPDGSIRWIRDRAFPIRNDHGTVYRVTGVAEDITERKRAQEELRNRYKELAILHDVSQITMKSTDLKPLLEKILDRALSVVSLDIGNIRLFEPGGRMQMGIYRGYRDPQNERAHHPDLQGLEGGVLTSQVITSGQISVVEDITTTEGLRTFKKESVCSAIVVPIMTREEKLGVIEIGSRAPRRFRPDEVRLLEAIGNQVGIAVQKARLLEETERRAHEQEALNVIAKATSQSLHLDELLEIVLDKVLAVTGRERVSVRLRDPGTGHVMLAAHRGFPQEEAEELRRRTSHAISEQVFATGQPIVINNSAESSNRELLLPQSHSVAWIPIKTGTNVVGVLGVSAGQAIPFEPREIALLQAIGNMIGVALENARLFGETQARYRELQILHAISATILDSLDLRLMMERILDQAFEIGKFDIGVIRLLNPAGDSLEPVASRGYRDPKNTQSHRRKVEGYTTGAGSARVLEDKAVHVVDLAQSNGLRTFKSEGICTIVAVPLRSHEDVLGVIQLGTRAPREFRESELRILEAIGGQAGIAVQKARLYEETRKQAQELEKANKMQADFTAMIAHDLRAPLANQMAVAEMLKEGVFGAITEEQKKWLEKIEHNAGNMVEQVSDFLDLSKLESGRVDLTKKILDLRTFIPGVAENYHILARDKGISLHCCVHQDLPEIVADPRRLDQVFNNLLSNAIKFTNEGGTIEVGTRLRKDSEIAVYVSDTGVGIPQDEIGSLFQKYRQTTSGKTSEHKGTGLGLVICKMIVEAHGGRIWVDSEEGKGTTFSFSLPIYVPAPEFDSVRKNQL
ncbi:MAG: GAF domain-containing protein [Candidatus Binatia bacterium]